MFQYENDTLEVNDEYIVTYLDDIVLSKPLVRTSDDFIRKINYFS